MRRKLAAILAAALLLTCCAACSAQPEEPAADRLRVTVVLPHFDPVYWLPLGQGAQDAGEELQVDVKLVAPQINYNLEQMADLIRQAGAAQVDAVIVQGAEDESFLDALRSVQAQGSAVILVDTDADLEDMAFIGSDSLAIGRQIGEVLCEELEGQAEVAVLSGKQGFQSCTLRLQGLEESIGSHPGMHIACVEYDEFDSLTVLEKYEQICREYPEVDTLVCLEGTGGYVLSRQLTAPAAIEHIYALDTSPDARQAAREGLFNGVFVQNPYEMGHLAVERAVEQCRTGEIPEDYYTGVDFFSTADLREEADGT